MAPSQLDCGYGLVEHLLLGLLELVLEVNIAGGDEGVNARTLGVFQRGGGALDIEGTGTGQGSDLHPGILAADGVHGFKVAIGGDRETGFQDIDAELHQLAGHAKLLGNRHAASGDCSPSRSVVSKM